jgi:hypothetical protein
MGERAPGFVPIKANDDKSFIFMAPSCHPVYIPITGGGKASQEAITAMRPWDEGVPMWVTGRSVRHNAALRGTQPTLGEDNTAATENRPTNRRLAFVFSGI